MFVSIRFHVRPSLLVRFVSMSFASMTFASMNELRTVKPLLPSNSLISRHKIPLLVTKLDEFRFFSFDTSELQIMCIIFYHSYGIDPQRISKESNAAQCTDQTSSFEFNLLFLHSFEPSPAKSTYDNLHPLFTATCQNFTPLAENVSFHPIFSTFSAFFQFQHLKNQYIRFL